MLVTASTEIKLHPWPLSASLEKVYAPSSPSRISNLSLSNDNNYITFLTESGRAEIITLKDRDDIKFVHCITAITDISALTFQRTTKKNLAIGTNSAQVALYDTRSKAITKLFRGVPSAVNRVAFNCKDQLLGVACNNGTVVVYDSMVGSGNGRICGNYTISYTCSPTALKFHQTEPNVLAAASDDGTVVVWDTNTTKKIFVAQTHTSSITGFALASTSDLLITVGTDNKFCIHDLTLRECVFRSSLQQPLTAVDVSSDGKIVAIGADDGTVYGYDLRNLLQPITNFKLHSRAVTQVAFENVPQELSEFNVREGSSEINTCVEDIQNQKMSLNFFRSQSNISKLLKENKPLKPTPTSRPESANKVYEEPFSMKAFKDAIINTVQKETEEARDQMVIHMSNLQNFIHNEFHKMEIQMDDKWEVLNLASLNVNAEQDIQKEEDKTQSNPSVERSSIVFE